MGKEEKPRKAKPKPSYSEQKDALILEINRLNDQIREKRKSLKQIQKAEEDYKKDQLMAAIAASGKSIDEMLTMLKA